VRWAIKINVLGVVIFNILLVWYVFNPSEITYNLKHLFNI